MSYSLNSLQKDIWGIIHRGFIGLLKGDFWSLDYRPYVLQNPWLNQMLQFSAVAGEVVTHVSARCFLWNLPQGIARFLKTGIVVLVLLPSPKVT